MDCKYCLGIGACPKCWGRAGYDRLKQENAALLEALEPFANKDHGHTMSTPRETCIYCAARAAIRAAKGGDSA